MQRNSSPVHPMLLMPAALSLGVVLEEGPRSAPPGYIRNRQRARRRRSTTLPSGLCEASLQPSESQTRSSLACPGPGPPPSISKRTPSSPRACACPRCNPWQTRAATASAGVNASVSPRSPARHAIPSCLPTIISQSLSILGRVRALSWAPMKRSR